VNHLRWWVAFVVLLTAAALVHGLPHGEPTVEHPPLASIPLSIAGWSAQDIPVAPHLVSVAHVDEFVNRIYRQPLAEDVGLYVGYYKSQRAGDSVHSPKNCLPGAGWQPVSASRILLPLQPGAPAVVNLYTVENGGQRFVVLYWYQSHGRIVASEYRAKFFTVRDAILLNRTDSALIRITVPVLSGEERARQTAVAFATLISPKLDAVIPH
jgi:EpsI family protein